MRGVMFSIQYVPLVILLAKPNGTCLGLRAQCCQCANSQNLPKLKDSFRRLIDIIYRLVLHVQAETVGTVTG